MSSERRNLADGVEVSHERERVDPLGRRMVSARIHARWPAALRSVALWVAELERKTGNRMTATFLEIGREIGRGARVEVRVRLMPPELPNTHPQHPDRRQEQEAS
jgi:hypothetical protein